MGVQRRVRLAAAAASGLAAAYGHRRRLSGSAALAELAEELGGLDPSERQTALDLAAVMYLDSPYRRDRAALLLLVAAGAKLAGARAHKAASGARTIIQASSDRSRARGAPRA